MRRTQHLNIKRYEYMIGKDAQAAWVAVDSVCFQAASEGDASSRG